MILSANLLHNRQKDGDVGHPFLLSEDKRISKKSFLRVNAQIRVAQVRLVNEQGEMVGLKTIQEALRLAEESGYDLIEIAPQAVPPVCKLGNYSKYLYEQEKKSKDQRKSKSSGQVKEIRIRPNIGEHDFIVKINAIQRFLKERHKVRVTLMFMGREMEHRDLGDGMMDRIEASIEPVGVIEQRPQLYGNRLISILVPK